MIVEPLFLIGYMVAQAINHLGAGRDYFGVVPKGKGTIRRAVFSSISVMLLAIFTWNIWAFALFPLFWLLLVPANDVSLCAIHGRSQDFMNAMNDGDQLIASIVRKIWPAKKLSSGKFLSFQTKIKLCSTLYEIISNVTMVPLIIGVAIIEQNYYGAIAALAFPIPAFSYLIAGFIGSERKAGKRAELITGGSLAYIIYVAATI